MSYLRYLCLFAYNSVFFVVVFVLCLIYSMLPISPDCHLFIGPSVFSSVYFISTATYLF